MWMLLVNALATPPQNTSLPAPGPGSALEVRAGPVVSSGIGWASGVVARIDRFRAGGSISVTQWVVTAGFVQWVAIDEGRVRVSPGLGGTFRQASWGCGGECKSWRTAGIHRWWLVSPGVLLEVDLGPFTGGVGLAWPVGNDLQSSASTMIETAVDFRLHDIVASRRAENTLRLAVGVTQSIDEPARASLGWRHQRGRFFAEASGGFTAEGAVAELALGMGIR